MVSIEKGLSNYDSNSKTNEKETFAETH